MKSSSMIAVVIAVFATIAAVSEAVTPSPRTVSENWGKQIDINKAPDRWPLLVVYF